MNDKVSKELRKDLEELYFVFSFSTLSTQNLQALQHEIDKLKKLYLGKYPSMIPTDFDIDIEIEVGVNGNSKDYIDSMNETYKNNNFHFVGVTERGEII